MIKPFFYGVRVMSKSAGALNKVARGKPQLTLEEAVGRLQSAGRNYDYTGDFSEFSEEVLTITAAARERQIDQYSAIRLIGGAFLGHKFQDVILRAILAGNPELIGREVADAAAQKLLSGYNRDGYYEAAVIISTFARVAPRLIGPNAFKRLIEASEYYAKLDKHSFGVSTENMYDPAGAIKNMLADPAHLAQLMVEIIPGDEFLSWVIHEKYDQAVLQHESWQGSFERASARDKEERARQLTAGMEIVRRETSAVTPVLTGSLQVDKMMTQGLSDDVGFLQIMASLSLPDQEEYISAALLAEIGKYLPTAKRRNALKLLKRIAAIDLNLILGSSQAFGKDIGQIIGLREKQAIDFQAIADNMKRYELKNLFSAWAIGRKKLSGPEINAVIAVETILQKETSAVIYRAISALLAEKHPWTMEEIQRLWTAKLFAEPKKLHPESAETIFSLFGANREKFMRLMERPGKLATWWDRPIAAPRFEAYLKELRGILQPPAEKFSQRLERLNSFLFVPFDEEIAKILALPKERMFIAEFDRLIAEGNFCLNISHGLRARAKSFREAYGELLATVTDPITFPVEKDTEEEENDLQKTLIMAARWLGIAFFAPSEKEIKEKFKELARQFHPDKNPADPEAEKKFKMAKESGEIFLAIIEEVETGKPLKDPMRHILPPESGEII